MKPKILELTEREEMVKHEIKIAEQNIRVIQNKKSSFMKNAMTRRLCDHGRLLEKYFPPDDFTDDQVEGILIGLLQNPRNKKAIEVLKGGGHISW